VHAAADMGEAILSSALIRRQSPKSAQKKQRTCPNTSQTAANYRYHRSPFDDLSARCCVSVASRLIARVVYAGSADRPLAARPPDAPAVA
jgi:hypothetical protein